MAVVRCTRAGGEVWDMVIPDATEEEARDWAERHLGSTDKIHANSQAGKGWKIAKILTDAEYEQERAERAAREEEERRAAELAAQQEALKGYPANAE